MDANKMHVLIIGAGPSGLTIAQCLRKAGISFQIFDRDTHQDARFQGYSISVHTVIGEFKARFSDDMPNFEQATSNLLPLTVPAQITVHYPSTDNRLGVENEPNYPYIRVERARLRRWLLTNIDVQWNMHATKFFHDENGAEVHFKDGSIAKGTFLMGCDGANSKIREHIIGRPNSEMLRTVPISTISGEMHLSGEAFRRQMELSHSAYNSICTSPRYVTLNGLHFVNPDGCSGGFYWDFFEEDDTVEDPNHWMRTATQSEKYDHVMRKIGTSLPSRLREAFELTPVSGILEKYHVWKDVRLESVPAGRAILVADAAHVMAPFRGLGGFNAFMDALHISRRLIGLRDEGKDGDIEAVKKAVSLYNDEMLTRGHAAVDRSREGTTYSINTAWFMEPILRWMPSYVKTFLDWLDPGNKLKTIPKTTLVMPIQEEKVAQAA